MDHVEWEQLSSRTQAKIVKRANLGCVICGWNEAPIDLHHIVEKQNNGADHIDNLISVCPNCHRIIHTHKQDFKTVEELQSMSLRHFEWRKYYNPGNKWAGVRPSKRPLQKIQCQQCGQVFNTRSANAKFCSLKCVNHNRRKVNRPTVEELTQLIQTKTFVAIGKQYGVSDNSVRKWAKAYNIL